MDANLSIPVAFGAGLISFLSPCVLPLVPGYLSFVSGVNIASVKQDEHAIDGRRGAVMLAALCFVLGFTAVFVALGATATAVGEFLLAHLPLLGKVAGAVLIAFGLNMLGVFKIAALYRESRFQVRQKPLGVLGAFVVGAAFAFGWTPCIGPILSGILALAGTQETMGQGMGLLASYSAGLGVPFLLAAFGIERFYRFFDAFKAHLRKVEIASGVLLIAVGVLMATGSLTRLSGLIPFVDRFAL